MDRDEAEAEDGLVDARFEDLMIVGYFGTRAKAGERPTYGYPPNHLPQASGTMKVRTAFLS